MFSTVTEWLFYLENRNINPINLDLENIATVAAAMQLLNPEATVITVAGTNGKGSTVRALAAIYEKAGYKTGSYISPHLQQFNERIAINQQLINDAQLVSIFAKIETARQNTELTYFETTTLAALEYFKQQKAEVIILEVGLGGRLDATNIIDTDLAIITTIDYDHQEYLGNSLEEIAYEKAGIMRASKKIIYADDFMPQVIREQAECKKCNLIKKQEDYSFDIENGWINFTYQTKKIRYFCPKLHPNSTAAAVMASLCLEKVLAVSDSHRIEALANLQLAGRYQFLDYPYPTLLDVSHNSQAVQNLCNYIKKNYPTKKLLLVFSALKDKNVFELIAAFKELPSTWFPALLSGPRAMTADEIITHLTAHGVSFKPCYTNPFLAYKAACRDAKDEDLIIVFGSFHTVAAVLNSLDEIGENRECFNG